MIVAWPATGFEEIRQPDAVAATEQRSARRRMCVGRGQSIDGHAVSQCVPTVLSSG